MQCAARAEIENKVVEAVSLIGLGACQLQWVELSSRGISFLSAPRQVRAQTDLSWNGSGGRSIVKSEVYLLAAPFPALSLRTVHARLPRSPRRTPPPSRAVLCIHLQRPADVAVTSVVSTSVCLSEGPRQRLRSERCSRAARSRVFANPD